MSPHALPRYTPRPTPAQLYALVVVSVLAQAPALTPEVVAAAHRVAAGVVEDLGRARSRS